MGPLARFFLAALLVWLGSWVPLGLYVGDVDYVITRVSRGSIERQIYQGFLYTGLLILFLKFWLSYAPQKPRRGRVPGFLGFFALGLLSTVVLRACLHFGGAHDLSFSGISGVQVTVALVSCLAVALVEEAVFRGFLLGRLVMSVGHRSGLLLTSVLFASVHLFRPGSLEFRLAYGLGLFLLGVLLAQIAWRFDSVLASAGFHAGIIFFNILLPYGDFQPSWWAGWNAEPVAGALSWGLTILLGVQIPIFGKLFAPASDAEPLA